MKLTSSFFFMILLLISCNHEKREKAVPKIRTYSGNALNRVAFPIGGIGAGMICLEGTGAFSHVSVRNSPDVFNTPFMFGAIALKGIENGAKVLEGPVQNWKIFGSPNTGNGSSLFGCPRFENASFEAKFPFGKVTLTDKNFPMNISFTGWSPFIPTDADNSSLPVGGLEYTFENTSGKEIEAVFSFHSDNFMRVETPSEWGGNYVGHDSIMQMNNGFILEQSCLPDKPHYKGEFAVFSDDPATVVDYCWFRGGWFDSKTILWKNIIEGKTPSNPVANNSKGASLYFPFKIASGATKTIRVMVSWYVPHSNLRLGWDDPNQKKKSEPKQCTPGSQCSSDSSFYEPWYSGKFASLKDLTNYWLTNYQSLKSKTELFTESFYNTDLPSEVVDAVGANLTILKSPTVLRQRNGKLWAWEGCHDQSGCCHGSCTHVWNYAQAIPHLFPSLERTLRETEFNISQNDAGHQAFRTSLPIRITDHNWYAAADGQLGGIIKMYRDWRISGDTEWLKKLWPKVKSSMDYAIDHWDPRRSGTIEEPHHNTYDIEFWGPDGMITGFYLGALQATSKMATAVGDNPEMYDDLLKKSASQMQTSLYNGEYFIQKVKWEGLNAPDPVAASKNSLGGGYSVEAMEILKKEGPKYQYGSGCLSDGALGFWMAEMSGMGHIFDPDKVLSHLTSVYKYNFKTDLSDFANPQRAGYAYGHEGGLLLCSWPKGGQPTFPFVYSNEVWTGIEYQVASHLMLMGKTTEGLNIVKEVRKRYDGTIRNPFNEYECGHWYARAMSSYGLLQGLTGCFYDALEKTLYLDSKYGKNYQSFFACGTGFGNVGLKNGKPFLQINYGSVNIKKCLLNGKEVKIEIHKLN